jgi:hypothetical protein
MRKKVKNKKINMFVRNDGKKTIMYMCFILCFIYVAKKEKKQKVMLFMGPKKPAK